MADNFSRNTLVGTLWMLTQKLGAQISTLVVFIILARLLDARDFGLMAMANVVVLFLSVFASQGLTAAIIQRQDLTPQHIDSAFWLNLMVGAGMLLLACASAPLISQWYGEPQVRLLIWALSVNVILESLISVQNSILQRNMAFKSLTIRKLIAEILSGILGIAMALAGFGVWSLVAKVVGSLVLQGFIFWWVTDWRPGWRFSKRHAGDIVGYGINVLAVNVVNFSSRQLDDLFVGLLLGANALGQYSIAKRLILTAVDVIRGGIGSVAWTMFAKIQQDRVRLGQGLQQINQWLCIAAWPLFLCLSLFPHFYVPLLFGEQWQSSIDIVRFLALAGLVEAVRCSHESLILAVGKSGLRLRLALLLTGSNFLAFFALYTGGIDQVVMGYAVIALVLFPCWAWTTVRLTDLSLGSYLGSFSQATVATILAFGVAGFWLGIYSPEPVIAGSAWQSLYQISAVLVIYGAVIALLNRKRLKAKLFKA